MRNSASHSQWFGDIPAPLREPLLQTFGEIERNYREHRWEPSELNGGKLCEVVYCILRGYVDGAYPAGPSGPKNFVVACQDFEKADKTKFSQAIRITIPRTLIALYEIRNHRGVGHAGGDVSPNEMDATYVLQASKWVVAELVRHFHKLSTAAAQAVVETLVERISPLIWVVGDKKRVLLPKASMKEKALLLLHGETGPLHEDVLSAWVEHTNKAVFRRDVLRLLHREKLAEFDEVTKFVHLSPMGIRVVESEILPRYLSSVAGAAS